MARLKLAFVFHKLFDFKAYKLNKVTLEDGAVIISIKRTRKTSDCPKCNRRSSNIEEKYGRILRDLNLGEKKCYIEFIEHKIKCRCGYRGVEKLEFADRYARQTKRFEEYVARLCQKMSVKDAAETAEIDWKTAKNIDMKYLGQLVVDLKKVTPTRIGVDEVSYRKGHKYLTVVRDLDMGRVIWVEKGRKKETLNLFFSELGEQKSELITVAVIDMWDAYIASIKENTNAKIIFDKFHIIKKVNEALDSIRRKEFANADPEERKDFKHKRFLILSRGERLSEEDTEKLDDLMAKNERLYQAYLLKEQVASIFDEQDEAIGLERLEKWFENVKDAGFKQFDSVVKTLRKYYYGVKNYFKYHLTNAASEGFNNKIGAIKRRAYGFRDLDYLMLKILQSCGWKTT